MSLLLLLKLIRLSKYVPLSLEFQPREKAKADDSYASTPEI
jgi:hypothetical protein